MLAFRWFVRFVFQYMHRAVIEGEIFELEIKNDDAGREGNLLFGGLSEACF